MKLKDIKHKEINNALTSNHIFKTLLFMTCKYNIDNNDFLRNEFNQLKIMIKNEISSYQRRKNGTIY